MTKVNSTDGYYPRVKGKKRQMAELLVNPDCNLTVTEMCEQVGISRTTFYNWQKDSEFNGYVNFLIDSFTDSELATAWKALVSKMKSGSLEALRMFFELKGVYKQGTPVGGSAVVIVNDIKSD